MDPARIEEDAGKARTHEFACCSAHETGQVDRAGLTHAVALDVIERFLREWEDDMHHEARDEPFVFSSHRHGAEVLAGRLGLRR